MGRRKKANPFRHLVRTKNRHGNARLYYRPPGGAWTRIHVDEHHEDFAAHYAAAKAGTPLPPPLPSPRVGQAIKDSLRALVETYERSAEFRQLAPQGQRDRLSILESCCDQIWPTAKQPIGDIPIKRIVDKHVRALIDAKADLPGAANNRLKYLRILFNWAKLSPNPVAGFKPLRPKRKDGFHAWTLAEVHRFEARHPVGTMARLALDLAIYTAARRGDIAKLGPQHVDAEGWLSFNQAKTNGEVDMPIIGPLATSIRATSIGDESFLVTQYGKPYSAAGLGNAFRGWCDEAKLPQCSLHGLRKAAAARLAELGATEEQIKAITGHTTSREVARYTRSAKRKLLAGSAMGLLEGDFSRPLLLAGPEEGRP